MTLFPFFLCLVGIQAYYIIWSQREKRRISAEEFGNEALGRILDDVELRAGRGQAPDWVAYSDQLDRLIEPALDRIRQFAGSCLATGIGGTMLLFAIELIASPNSLAEPSALAGPALLAVLSSIIGIAAHLYLVLHVLQGSQHKADKAVLALHDRVQDRSRESPPVNRFGEGFRLELSQAFAEALAQFPAVMRQVDESVLHLKDMAEKQLSEIASASLGLAHRYSELTYAAQNLTDSAQTVGTTADRVVQGASELDKLPRLIEKSLKEASNVWRKEISNGQDGFVSAVKETLSGQRGLLQEMQTRFEDQGAMVETVLDKNGKRLEQIVGRFDLLSTLLQNFPEESRKAQEGMSDKFGKAADNHVLALRNSITSAIEELRKAVEDNHRKMRQEFVSRNHDIVKAIFDRLEEQISATIVGPLSDIGLHLAATTTIVPDAAKKLSDSLFLSMEVLKALPKRLDSTTARIEDMTSTVESAITDSMSKAWEPVRDDTQDFYKYARTAHEEISGTVKSLVEFIEELIGRIELEMP